jgi:magnesium-transporting ATPase (P-type)
VCKLLCCVFSRLQLLWVNLIMDTLGALALATETPSPKLLVRNLDYPSLPFCFPAPSQLLMRKP